MGILFVSHCEGDEQSEVDDFVTQATEMMQNKLYFYYDLFMANIGTIKWNFMKYFG